MKQSILDQAEDKRHENTGRPRKLDERDERSILRQLHDLRDTVGTSSSKDIQVASSISNVCNRTVRRVLKKHGYGYYQCRKKGMLSKQDLGKRLAFALKCKKLSSTFWTEGILFYLDGTGWVHKTDPCGQTRTYRTRMWMK